MSPTSAVLFLHCGLPANLAYPLRAKREHLGIGYLLAAVRSEGFSADVVDGDILDLDRTDMLTNVVGRSCDIFAVAMSSQLGAPESYELIKTLKRLRPDVPVIVGGHFPSIAHRVMLENWPDIDVIVRGEPELRIAEICSRLITRGSLAGIAGVTYRSGAGIISTEAAGVLEDLDRVLPPARDTLGTVLAAGQPASILSSRGCYGGCHFCTQHAFYGGSRWRPRRPAAVVAEIGELRATFNVQKLRFYDDDFVGPGATGRAHAENIASAIIARGLKVSFEIYCRANDITEPTFSRLKAAGLTAVTCGIESGSDASLRRYGKRTNIAINRRAASILRSCGVELKAAMIMFDPDCTIDDVDASLDLLADLSSEQPANSLFFADEEVLPYYGTTFTKSLGSGGYLKDTEWYHIPSYRFRDPTVQKLFDIVTTVKPSTLLLQRYWVEFMLRRRSDEAPASLRAANRPGL